MIKLHELIRSSLIRKILFVFVIGTVVFISLVFLTTRYVIENKVLPRVNHNNINYTKLLIDEIEDVTDTTKINEIAKGKDIFTAVKNDTIFWKSIKDHDLVELDDLAKIKNENNIWAGFDHGHHIVYLIDGTYIYFSLERRSEGFSYFEEIIILVNFTYFLIIIYLIFRIIRYILNPVDKLINGVKKVSEGNFDNKIETKRTDELGTLIHSYNDMSHQVSNMIKSKEQLLLDVSHEMRSPLTRMKLGIEFIENAKTKNNILEDVNDLDKMITELLETERMNSSYGGINKSEMNLYQLIEEVALQYSKVELKIGTDEIIINADKERLRLLLKNIIENAVKYSGNSSESVFVSVIDKANDIQISIEDRGEGIQEDRLESIFEPFYRVDKSRTKDSGGFGLGLHLCKKIVEAHKGEISVESKIGEGTTFNIIIPKA